MNIVSYIVANYLKVLRVQERTAEEMIGFLESHSSYPSLRSIVECFEEWQFQCTAATATLDQLEELNEFFIAFLSLPDNAFVFVIKAESDRIIYLDSQLQVVTESLEDFDKKWAKVVFIAEMESNSGIKKTNTPARQPGSMPSIKELKQVAYHQEEPYSFKVFRRVSIYLSYVFARLRVQPSFITALWAATLLFASYLVSTTTDRWSRLVCAAAVCIYYILDCSDGEVARSTHTSSDAGSHLEAISHWVTNLTLIAGTSFGLFRQTPDAGTLLLGLGCLVSDASFHYLYIQLNYWLKEMDYGFFHKVTAAIYVVMPLNLNLFFLGCLLNALHLYLVLWCCISSVFFALLAISYFSREFSLLKKKVS